VETGRGGLTVKMSDLRSLPSVDQLLQSPEVAELVALYGRPLTLQALRETLEGVRQRYADTGAVPGQEALIDKARSRLETWVSPTLIPVINASGVVLHTNLGRAPLSSAALQAAREVSQGYSTLEYDLEEGQRGSRLVHAEKALCRLTGAEGALVVNNNAAAVLLILTALARDQGVVIARSQLVEIGGGFRIPEVMAQSGAHLVEVGATNRVHLSDYERAMEHMPALVMRAHRSNFRIVGFTSEPTLEEIAAVAERYDLLVVDDVGSGSLLDTTRFGLAGEPMVQESLQKGAALVCFSGDKLLGGPQAGIVIGRGDLIERLKRHPLARAVRADKLCLSALAITLGHYLKDEAEREIPIWRMISADLDGLHERAQRWAQVLGQGEVIQGQSTVGGGSLPGETLPTWLLAVNAPHATSLLALLRANRPPIIARIQDEAVVLDPRTVLPEQEGHLLEGLKSALKA
jgi:L-seryl-tRNA(Ser) seleniumtransferase